jgi:hypothetical protein
MPRNSGTKQVISLEEFFAGQEDSTNIFETLRRVVEGLGEVEIRVTKSQVAFRRRGAFAWAWMPGKYLHGKTAPLVLSVALRRRDPSPRWKEIVEPRPGWFMHHLELYSSGEIDGQVRLWLQQAWEAAG